MQSDDSQLTRIERQPEGGMLCMLNRPEVMSASNAGQHLLLVKKECAQLHHGALIDHARAKLPPYFIPRFIEFMTELPKTATNRVQSVMRSTLIVVSTRDSDRAGK